MLTKIAATITDKQKDGQEVTVQQIKDLTANYFDNLYIMDRGKMRKQDHWDRDNDEKNDTRTITFSKDRILELFKNTPDSKELVMHIGLHNLKIFSAGVPKSYNHKVMVVLAGKDVDQLKVDDVVMITGVNGGGIDNGKLCPPDTTCISGS